MTDFQIRLRSYIFRVVVLMAFMILAGQLYYLQVTEGDTYRELADANRFRTVQVLASRGVMYDRDGDLLVRNRPTYNVIIIPAYLPDDPTEEARIFARLSELLNLPITTQIEPVTSHTNGYFGAIRHHQYTRQLQHQIINPRSRQFANAPLGIRDAVNEDRATAPYLPVVIAEDVDPIIISKIEEERLSLPGVIIEISPTREYLYGELFSHILGYTGPIPGEQFADYQENGYDITDVVGLSALEAEYEEWLRGVKGLERIEVDVSGQRIRTVSQLIEARPGYNLRLSIDRDLQEATAIALQEQMDEVDSSQGVAIAMNPQNGEILAMVTLPSYDNNIFARGITPRELAILSEDPWTPLINHAIAGLYPPGSTYKIIPAAGALQEQVVTPETTFIAEGIMYLPNQFQPDNFDLAQPFYCWLREGHGEVNLFASLMYSCDIYYYQIGGGYEPNEFVGLGLTRLANYSEMFGLGQPTGIDLPGEARGLVPTQRWKRLNYAESWVTGDTYNMSIGQGFVLATPLQILNATAAIANGGTLYRPHIIREILNEDGNIVSVSGPQIIRQLAVDPAHIRLIQDALRAVISEGTADDTFDVPGIVASGKTGTAEYCDDYPECIDRDGRVQTSHAWFTSYAPSFNPEIATVVFVYGGDEGSQTAVPVTNRMLRHYFGIRDEEADIDAEATENLLITEQPISVQSVFQGRLLGSAGWSSEQALVSGVVFDPNGQPVVGIPVDIIGNGRVLSQLFTDGDGQFEIELDPQTATTWQIRLSGYPNADLIQLDIMDGTRYILEFTALPLDDSGNDDDSG